MDILIVDIGGTHVKLRLGSGGDVRRFASGPTLTPIGLMQHVRAETQGWNFDMVSIGYPGAVGPRGPVDVAGNLGPGWVGFEFGAAFKCPVRVANDAALQALGSYDGGRMLFLGLGTGLGSALVAERVVLRLELGSIECGAGTTTIAERIGNQGLMESGEALWRESVTHAVGMLRRALAADYVVIGGGNAPKVDVLPEGARRGGNDDAFLGGVRLWEQVVEHHDRPPSPAWRILR